MSTNHEPRTTNHEPSQYIDDVDLAWAMAAAGNLYRSTAARLRKRGVNRRGKDDAHANRLEVDAGLDFVAKRQAEIDAMQTELNDQKKRILTGAKREHDISSEYWGEGAIMQLAEKYGLPEGHFIHIETPEESIVTYARSTGIRLGDRDDPRLMYEWWDAIESNGLSMNGKRLDYQVEVAGEVFDTRAMTAEAYRLLVKEMVEKGIGAPRESGFTRDGSWRYEPVTMLLGEDRYRGNIGYEGLPIGYVKDGVARTDRTHPETEGPVDFRPTIIRKHS